MEDWEKIYGAFFWPVYRFVFSVCGNEDLSQEICSETFLKAMTASKGPSKPESVQNWLFSIAKNTLISKWRKEERIVLSEDAFLESQPVENQRKSSDDSRTDQLPKLIMKLPHPQQEIVMWRLYGNMEFNQIGELFNQSGNWACVNYHRAMTKIRNLMEEKTDGREN